MDRSACTGCNLRRNTGLSVGNHHLNGDQALKVARSRVEGVFARVDNQNMVLCALRDKLTDPKVVTQIPDLITSFQDNIVTDLSPQQLSQLAASHTMPAGNIAFVSFPQEFLKQRGHTIPSWKKCIYLGRDFNICASMWRVSTQEPGRTKRRGEHR